MKKKLIAMMLAATLVGGVGATTYATAAENPINNAVLQKLSNEGNVDKLSENCDNSQATAAQNNTLATGNEATQGESEEEGFFSKFCGSVGDIFNDFKCFIMDMMGITPPTENDNSGGSNEENNGEQTPGDEVVKPEETPDGGSGNETPDKEEPPVTEEVPPTEEETTTPPVVNPPVVTPEEETPSKPVDSDKFMSQVEQMIYQKVNAERAKAGMSPLTYNNTMQKYARIKSADMGDRGYFDHKDPQGNLITAQMKKDGVSYRAWGENIAYIGGMSDASALADRFMTNWMNSPGHRANILSSNFSDIGVGVYRIGNTVYATQEFYK